MDGESAGLGMTDASRCPRCEQNNGCVMAAGQNEAHRCWCAHIEVGEAVLREIEVNDRCLCRACAGRSDQE